MSNSLFTDEIVEIIASTGLNYELAFPFIVIPSKKIAFCIPALCDYENPLHFQNLSIEYEAQGIQLIFLWEDVWKSKKELVKSRIRAILGEFKSIHARKTKVAPINKDILDNFLAQNHLQGSPHVRHKYGLFYQKQLVAAASFSDARPIIRNGILYRSIELVRFANLDGHRVVGGLGKLLNTFIENHKPGDLMSYVDRDWSCGSSYEKLGFSFIENTEPQAFWVHPGTGARLYAHRLKEEQTEEKLCEQGYVRIFNAGNKKYIKLLQ